MHFFLIHIYFFSGSNGEEEKKEEDGKGGRRVKSSCSFSRKGSRIDRSRIQETKWNKMSQGKEYERCKDI